MVPPRKLAAPLNTLVYSYSFLPSGLLCDIVNSIPIVPYVSVYDKFENTTSDTIMYELVRATEELVASVMVILPPATLKTVGSIIDNGILKSNEVAVLLAAGVFIADEFRIV